MSANNRKNPEPEECYGYYNMGRLVGVRNLKRDAINAVEKLTGDPWSKAKQYMEVHKVKVEKI